jgi:hypothetical protein
MTAIYTVWNNYGFALASDSNQTAAQKDQTWVDPVEKILLLKNHQIAIGAAGNAMHEGIEVNEIVRSWEKQLPEIGFPKLDDYFIDFVFWFANQKFNSSYTAPETYTDFAHRRFETYKLYSSMQADPLNVDEFLDFHVANAKVGRFASNLFGSAWDSYADDGELLENATTTLEKKNRHVQSIREQIATNGKLVKPISGSNEFPHIMDQDDYDEDLQLKILSNFESVFQRKFDAKNSIDNVYLQKIFEELENDLDFIFDVNFQIVGYGNDDWLPTSIKFDVTESLSGVPRVKISDYSNPNYNWYLALAQNSAVSQLTRGHTTEREQEIIEMAEPHIKKDHHADFAQGLGNIANAKFQNSVKRLDFLTLDRLEFVSRLFVQIEALRSYLDEPVPGVGGDTKVISMTKTTRKERIFKELG